MKYLTIEKFFQVTVGLLEKGSRIIPDSLASLSMNDTECPKTSYWKNLENLKADSKEPAFKEVD